MQLRQGNLKFIIILSTIVLKFLFLSPPRLGKTTVCHHLMGDIVDLQTAGEAEKVQPSTETVES